MGLLSNNYRDTLGAVKFYGATTSNGAFPYIGTPSTTMPGAARNIFATDAGISALSSKPTGARPPVAWQMPQKPGGLSSRNATIVTLSTEASGALGLPASGSTTITFTESGTGGLIVSGSGTSTITFSESATLISVASGSGSAAIEFTASGAIGALAGLSGSSTITLTPSMVSYAIGYLSGTATNETEFSADALARAVWEALASDFNTPGSMGEKLNDAGAAGNPWAALLVDNNDAGTFGERVQKLLTTAKFLGLK